MIDGQVHLKTALFFFSARGGHGKWNLVVERGTCLGGPCMDMVGPEMGAASHRKNGHLIYSPPLVAEVEAALDLLLSSKSWGLVNSGSRAHLRSS